MVLSVKSPFLWQNPIFVFFWGGSIVTKKNCAFWPCPDGRLLNPLGVQLRLEMNKPHKLEYSL